MTKAFVLCFLVSVLTVAFGDCATAQQKPTTRASAESRREHLTRYNTDGFKQLTVMLGIETMYGQTPQGAALPQGAVITKIAAGTAAENAGLRVGDTILEVGGVPVGEFGPRVYYVWMYYKLAKQSNLEFTIAFEDATTGEYKYYYPVIQLDTVAAAARAE
ncbi:MAG: hypothetical protein JWP89_2717 [Schlesneria sp.]|nr:hypothetical protein [Schlesneria sp.]